MRSSAPAVLLDVDGTLVDSTYHHTLSWARALSAFDLVVPLWRIHRQIGKGGDRMVADLCGEEAERAHGEAIRAAQGERYGELIGEVRPLPRAHELLRTLDEQGTTVVLASSSKQEELDHYLDLLDARSLVRDATSSADADATKPAPDILEVALDRAGTRRAVMLGDATWDCEAAARAGIPCVGLLTGGFSAQELRDAGAREVFGELGSLVDALPAALAP